MKRHCCYRQTIPFEQFTERDAEMKKLIRLWCFLHGHDWVSVSADNGRSVMARHECARCEAYRDMQYDYGT